MWSVILFEKDNTVEVVPTNWFKNGLCAWPKKDERTKINHRIQPNKFDFDFYSARILKKGIESLQEARSKLKIAEIKSDLSTEEDDNKYKRKKFKNKLPVPDPPTYSSTKYIEGTIKTIEEKKSHSLETNKYVTRKNTNSITPGNGKSDDSEDQDDIDNDPSYVLPEKNVEDIMIIDSPPIKSQMVNSNNIIQTYSKSVPSTSAMQKFSRQKFYSEDKVHNEKLKKIHSTTSTKRKLFDSIDNTSSEDYTIHTSASPFKVTLMPSINSQKKSFDDLFLTNSPLSESSILNKTKTNENLNMNHKCILKCEDIIEIVNKILRVALKTKYDVETISQKQDQLETAITNSIFHKEMNLQNVSNISEEDNYFEMLPIKNEDALTEFEEKLSRDKVFRSNLISELKRNAKRNLTATVRQLLRTLFHDSLLKEYSFKGQKSKKVFSTLTSCFVIFEAIRKMKQYQNVTNAEIQSPLTIYIAGASFRIKKND